MFSVGIGVAKKNISLKLINVINLLKINFDRTKSPFDWILNTPLNVVTHYYIQRRIQNPVKHT